MLTNTQFIILYICSSLCVFYLGMRLQARIERKRRFDYTTRAYNRGWQAGNRFLDRIQEERTDMDSAVRILAGEYADAHRPNPKE